MASDDANSVRALLLTRRGLAFPPEATRAPDPRLARGVALELAGLGYLPSSRLEGHLARCTPAALTTFLASAKAALLAQVGGDQKHEPLFRSFPDGVPADTTALWWMKVLAHYQQAEGQPCLFCAEQGTTHVLRPCRHVVCSRCFDGSSYSACPVCERPVDRSSPFFLPSAPRGAPAERVTFKLLELGGDLDVEARALLVSLCERTQALSPADRDALVTLLRGYGVRALAWLPERIPVREVVATVFGTLFLACPPAEVLPQARQHMKTATDVLRFIAVISGTDGSLQRETAFREVTREDIGRRYWGPLSALFDKPAGAVMKTYRVPIELHRFKVARLPRPLRRALLELLEGMEPAALTEDMLRHREYWVWVGEFLHPHEHARRCPSVARAFQLLRRKAPDGTPAPSFEGHAGRVERAVQAGDIPALLAMLAPRPGELGRRLDHLLRLAGGDEPRVTLVVDSFAERVTALPTPMLLTLRSHLTTRLAKAPRRVYWPKGRVGLGVSAPDERAPLGPEAVRELEAILDGELLRRFGERPRFATGIVDDALRKVIVPFNERTASPGAVALPRGSRVAVPRGKLLRLFLHWCRPEVGGESTDLDLSVALYDYAFAYVGVCSYYQLTSAAPDGSILARSAGDLRDGPFPDGATEFVDVYRDRLLAAGVRYAVMVVNNYSGMPFSALERAFAGVMLRDDAGGAHFDPRTATLKFALTGENGVFMPLVLDVWESELHWLDVHARGELEYNNVATSNKAISTVCPTLMEYFASGARPSMFDLAVYHAASRCARVVLRGEAQRAYTRRPDEGAVAFRERILHGPADEPAAALPAALEPAAFAALYQGGIALPPGSAVYALFREGLVPTLAASDLVG